MSSLTALFTSPDSEKMIANVNKVLETLLIMPISVVVCYSGHHSEKGRA